MTNEKIPDMWASIKKHAESVPSPAKYTGQKKTFGKGKFFSPKSKRVTEFEEITRSAKKSPAPNQYKIKGLAPTSKLPVQKSGRLGFVDHARAQAKDTPGFYKWDDKHTSKRAICLPQSKAKKDLMEKFKKDGSPSPQSYKVNDRQTRRRSL